MKKLSVSILFLLFLFTEQNLPQNWLKDFDQNGEFNLKSLTTKFDSYWKDKKPIKGSGFKQYKRIEWFLTPRLWKTNTLPDMSRIYSDYVKYNKKSTDANQLQNTDWTPLGPNVKPTANQFFPPSGLGRISCMEFSPNNEEIIYAGSATGGIWKTTNSGANWTALNLSSIMSISIADIAISAANPQIIYAGTGDADASGFLGTNFSYSIGVLKSTDAGQTWSVTNLSYQIAEKILVNRLLAHPANPDLVYAATTGGLYKTTNGGNNWTKINADYCREIKFQPDDPGIIYAAFKTTSGIYSIQKYFESGGNFIQQQEFNDVSRLTFATNKKNPKTVYALAATAYPYFAFHSLWRTTDGNVWQKISDQSNSSNYLNFFYNGIGMEGQGMYDLSLETNQQNSDEVFLGGVNIWKSTNGGKLFSCIAEWTGDVNLPWVHADIHMLKTNKNGVIYACTDGGISKSTNNGSQWIDVSNGLGISQFYSISCYPNSEYKITGGSQDNGTHYFDGTTWKNIYGGDGMITIIDYSNPQIIYSSLYNGTINKSTNGGATFKEIISSDITKEEGEWVTPYMLHPTDPNTIYVAMQNVWKSTDGGIKWVKISDFNESQPLKIQSMAISPSNPNYIYISKYNAIYRTTLGGGTWTQIGSVPEFVTSILVVPNTPNKFWATESGYSSGNKVVFYDGQKWINISDGLPNVPVNCIEYQKNTQDRIYVGTDVGVFTRDNSNPTWESFNKGMPNIIINALNVHYASGKLRAATYGRGLWETKVVECNITKPVVTLTGETSLCDGDSVKLEVTGNYASYLWSTGSRTRSIWVKSSGAYSLTVTDANNCSATSDIINISVTQTPNFTIKNIGKDTICENSSTDLTVSSYAYKYYKWSNGDTTKKTTITKAGTYWVECRTADGCMKQSSNQIVISIAPLPPKPVITEQNDLLISSEAISYQWYLNDVKLDGEINRQIKPKAIGLYKVEAFDINSCSSFSDAYNLISSVVESGNNYYELIPNPTTGIVNIKMKNVNNQVRVISSVDVYELTGNKVLTLTVIKDNNEIPLNLTNLPAGIYYVYINEITKTSIFKISKIN